MPELSRPAARAHWLAWCRDYWVRLAAVIFFASLAWPFLRKGERGEWRQCFVRAAYRLQAGQRIHHALEPNAYAYPPAMAMLAVPLANLPAGASLMAWYLVNVVALSVAVVCAWRLIGGESLTALGGRPAAVLGLGLLLASRFLIAPLENQQFDAVIAACLMAGCLALARGQTTCAAMLLGLAAGMKCTPLLFAPYLIWRGQFKAAGVLMFVAVALNRLPDWLWPQTAGVSYLGDWVGTFLLKVGRTAPGVWDSDLVLNQSLSALVNRYFQAGLPLSAADLPTAHAALSDATIRVMRWLTYGVSAVMLAVTAWRMGRPMQGCRVQGSEGYRVQGSGFRKASIASTAEQVGDARRIPVFARDWVEIRPAIEASAILCLMLLLSPMSSKAHYVVLLLPCLVLARAIVEGRCKGRWWLPPQLVFGPLTSKGITGKTLGDVLLAWGFPTWFAIVLLAAMWTLLGRITHQRPHACDGVDDGSPTRKRGETGPDP